jgi:hypothetical protein
MPPTCGPSVGARITVRIIRRRACGAQCEGTPALGTSRCVTLPNSNPESGPWPRSARKKEARFEPGF